MKEAFSYIFRFLYMMAVFIALFIWGASNAADSKSILTFRDGFAVDSKGDIYVGRTYDIVVFSPDGEMISVLPISIYKSYFTISDDVIIKSVGNNYDLYNLSGEFVGTIAKDSEAGRSIYQLGANSDFVAEDGTRYRLKFRAGRAYIYRESEDGYVPVVKMPMQDYCTKMVVIALFISMVVCSFSFAKDIYPEHFEELKRDFKYEIKNLYTK